MSEIETILAIREPTKSQVRPIDLGLFKNMGHRNWREQNLNKLRTWIISIIIVAVWFVQIAFNTMLLINRFSF